MRVLWFTPIPLESSENKNGGGWLYGLRDAIVKCNEVELAIASFVNGIWNKHVGEFVSYDMPFPHVAILRKFRYKIRRGGYLQMERNTWPMYERVMLRVIEDFRPDIIEVFGSEGPCGLVASRTKIPVVLHIQGILSPYYNAFLPPFVSWWRFFFGDLSPKRIYSRIMERVGWECRVMREREICHRVKYFLGRTVWDERITKWLNPCADYRYGGEILRSVFYRGHSRVIPEKLTLVTTISSPPYKGVDLVLKSALLLKETLDENFEWKVFGVTGLRLYERKFSIHHEKVGIKLMGRATAEELCFHLSHATVYVHPSYIDNSPNSVCEAQMIGCTPIVVNAGGTPYLIEEGQTGFSVPANDPFQMACLILKLHRDKELNWSIGEKAKAVAYKRHDKNEIVQSLLEDYRKISFSAM